MRHGAGGFALYSLGVSVLWIAGLVLESLRLDAAGSTKTAQA